MRNFILFLLFILVNCNLKVKFDNTPFLKIFSMFQSNGNSVITETVATPTFSPPVGKYNTDQQVTISSATSGVSIYYTLDGSAPTINSTLYSNAIAISGQGTNKTIQTIAVKSGMKDSSIASGTYTIDYNSVSMPTFNPLPGNYNTDQLITLNSTTSGAVIYYTLDGSIPTSSSTKYTSAISTSGIVATTITIQAIATKSGSTDSSTASGTYVLNRTIVSTPTFDPSPGNYNTSQTVTLSTITSGATIYYTLDSSTPSALSTKYTGAISTTGNGTTTTIKAIAVKNEMTNSDIATGIYGIQPIGTFDSTSFDSCVFE